jgi:hypothetical protein
MIAGVKRERTAAVSDNSDGIIREVDEEFRRDQMLALWKRYGASFVAATALVLVLVISWQLWSNWQESVLRDNANVYAALDEQAANAPAGDATQIYAEGASDLEGSYRVLAGLQEAGELMNEGSYEQAIQVYDQMADLTEDLRIKDFAHYMAASAESATGLDDAAIARLQALAVPGAPFQFNAMELLAALHAKNGDRVSARAEFEAILDDPKAPQGIAARASDMIALYDQEARLDDDTASTSIPVSETDEADDTHDQEGAQ